MHPFASAPLDDDPFAGLQIEVSDAVKERLKKRCRPSIWTEPTPPEAMSRTGDLRLSRKATLPNRRKSLGLRSVCSAVRMVAGEMIALTMPRGSYDRDRRFAVSHVQQIAMYVCHVSLQLTMTDVARGFSRDRTTVGHACARVEDRRDDRAFDDLVAAVERVVAAVFVAGSKADG